MEQPTILRNSVRALTNIYGSTAIKAMYAVEFLGAIRTLILKLDEEIFRKFSVTAYLELSSLSRDIREERDRTQDEEHVFLFVFVISIQTTKLTFKAVHSHVDWARVNVGNVASVSDIPATSIFTVEVIMHVIYV